MARYFEDWVSRALCLTLLMALLLCGPGLGNGEEGKGEKVKSQGGAQGLLEKCRDRGFIRVLVEVRLEARQGSEGKAEKVEAAIGEAQDRLLAELGRKGLLPKRAHKYKFIPFMAMTVDSPVLEALLACPDVVSVQEDRPVPATGGPK